MAKLNALFPNELGSGGADNRKSPVKPGAGPLAALQHTFVSDFAPGQDVDGVYLVQEATLRAAKNGSKYVQASLGDKTGMIATRQWDATEKDAAAYQPGGYVRLRGRIETYQNRPQMIAFQVAAMASTEVDPADFLPVSTRPVEEMAREFDALLASLKDPDYKRLLEALFVQDTALREAFLRGPAASSIHHAWVSGLVEHVLSACKTAEAIAQQRPFLNRDLLLAGVILHDLGKIEELDPGAGFGYTDAGRLCGHIALGTLMVERKLLGLGSFPAHKRLLLLHMILSHHGEREYGSPVTPCTAEAVALHHIECLDAKVQGIRTIIEREEGAGQTGLWSEFSRVIDGKIYKG